MRPASFYLSHKVRVLFQESETAISMIRTLLIHYDVQNRHKGNFFCFGFDGIITILFNCRETSGKKSRSGSASILKSSNKLADTIEEGQKENDKPTDTEESQEKGKKKSRVPPAPKPRHPRDHPMAKVVGKTRTLIGQYKKAQVSTAFWDPEKSQKGSNMEKQMKRKAEKLAKEKSRQADRNILTDRLVEDFLGKNPVPEVPENENPVTSYAQVRNLLIDRQISLVSKLDLQDYEAEIPE